MAHIKVPCNMCGGDGLDARQEYGICHHCDGTGIVLSGEIAEIDDINAKVNDIIAEQASQREDLTAALTQIWNKVKDL